MKLTALLLSRLRWAFTISFHSIFPAFTIGLAVWLTVVEALHFATGRPACRQVFELWREIFGVAFRLGVASGIVIALQFGASRSELSRMSGPSRAHSFTRFLLEASFFGILLFGPAMVAFSVALSAFLIRTNNSLMQVLPTSASHSRCSARRSNLATVAKMFNQAPFRSIGQQINLVESAVHTRRPFCALLH
jgi:cytochrome bd ubiquinol oxidase subunit I